MPDAISGPGYAGYTPASSQADRGDQMGKDVFLKLLVAQMKYQDPSKPADSSQMVAQTAAFTQVQKLEEIAKQNASMLALQRSSSAAALVGRTVTYTDENGAAQTGTVSAVRLGSDTSEAVAIVGGAEVAMGRITKVAGSAAS